MNGITRHASGKRIAVLAAGIAAVPLLAGCFNGFAAQTSVQPPSGDGLSTQVGDVQIRSAVWVRSPSNPTDFTLSATFVNTGQTPDALTAVSTDTKGAVEITGGTIPLTKIAETRTGYRSTYYINLSGALVPPSNYISTTFTFAKAGAVTGSVLVVPSEGIYEGITPNGVPAPKKPEVSPLASKSASASESASASASASASTSEVAVP